MKVIASVIVLTALSLCPPPKAECTPAYGSPAMQTQQDPRFGTWQREVSDATGRTKIVLELRSDGTYTKSLDAFLKGHNFQASEEGTWTANGPLVRLSGGEAPLPRATTSETIKSSRRAPTRALPPPLPKTQAGP